MGNVLDRVAEAILLACVRPRARTIPLDDDDDRVPSISSFHARVSPSRRRGVHARRRARIIQVRAAAEFVGHAVDRGESYDSREEERTERHQPVALDDAVGSWHRARGSANVSTDLLVAKSRV